MSEETAVKPLDKLNKDELVARAVELGLHVAPDDVTKKDLVALIKEAEGTDETDAASDAAAADMDPAEQEAPAPVPVVKSGGRIVKIRKFFGSYIDAVFVADSTGEFGVGEVSDSTLNALRGDFPGAEIEEVS